MILLNHRCTILSVYLTVNVNRLKDFDDIRKTESMLERRTMEKVKRMHMNDNMSESITVSIEIDWFP